MATTRTTFAIDTEVAPAYLNDLLVFTNQNYLAQNPNVFVNVRWGTVNGAYTLSFTVVGPERSWYMDVEMKASKPIQVTVTPTGGTVPPYAFERLRDDLFINIQIFEERVRTTTLYFAWTEREEIVPETNETSSRKALGNIFADSMMLFYVITLVASILLFQFLGLLAPIVIIAFQFLGLLLSPQIVGRLGKWRIDASNRKIHLFQYHLAQQEYEEFTKKYTEDSVLKMKSEIYARTLALGRAPSCDVGREVFKKYGIECVPERLSVKSIDVYDIVRRAAEKFRLPIPKIVVSNTTPPNAAAVGVNPSRGLILITTGLLVQLEEDEILSVVGHELGHLKGRDSLNMFGLFAVEYLLRIYVFLPIFLFFWYFYLFAAMGVVYFVAKFFEARADLLSAIVIGQPQVMAEALRKIGFRRLQYERMPQYRAQGWLSWDPHPPTYFRITRLERMKAPVEIKHPLIQSAKDVIRGFRSTF
jgi:heat shock protein HtpX